MLRFLWKGFSIEGLMFTGHELVLWVELEDTIASWKKSLPFLDYWTWKMTNITATPSSSSAPTFPLMLMKVVERNAKGDIFSYFYFSLIFIFMKEFSSVALHLSLLLRYYSTLNTIKDKRTLDLNTCFNALIETQTGQLRETFSVLGQLKGCCFKYTGHTHLWFWSSSCKNLCYNLCSRNALNAFLIIT